MMKAMLVENERLVLREVEMPVAKADEVLIEVRAIGINRADLLQRSGKYPSPKGWPAWPGLEVAGTIKSMGEEAAASGKFQIGDKVCALLVVADIQNTLVHRMEWLCLCQKTYRLKRHQHYLKHMRPRT